MRVVMRKNKWIGRKYFFYYKKSTGYITFIPLIITLTFYMQVDTSTII